MWRTFAVKCANPCKKNLCAEGSAKMQFTNESNPISEPLTKQRAVSATPHHRDEENDLKRNTCMKAVRRS
jgi:hypothetical protein